MTVLEAIQRSTEFLERKGVESPRLQSELLLAHVLAVPRLRLYLDFERQLSDGHTERLRELVKRRGSREPLQHLVGSTSFCGLEIRTGPGALIPRPETEVLAEVAWGWLGSMATTYPGPRVLDFGTGTGCLAIALAVRCPAARITALEVSPEALACAQANAGQHGVTERIEFIGGDGFSALPPGAEFDLIVSNPPYIASAEIATLQPEVRDHDPRVALDGGPDGLSCIRHIAEDGSRCLRSGGRIMVEFGDGQAGAVLTVFGGDVWCEQTVHNDLTGRPRILVATRTAK